MLRQFRVRPHCRSFLRLMSQYFEIVVFTAAQEDYANFILDQLDPTGEMIKHRLYRQHIILVDGQCIKDLSRLGRPLTRTIIVDNLSENFKRQPFNGIEIKTWKSDPLD